MAITCYDVTISQSTFILASSCNMHRWCSMADLFQNGLLTSLPHICNAIIMVVVGVVSDVVTSKSYLSITAARRLFQGICEQLVKPFDWLIQSCDCVS